MKKFVKTLSLFSALLFVCSCATQPLPPPEQKYEKDAIHLYLKSDPKLNLNEGMPHTLLVCAYQLKDPNAFNQLLNDDDGLYELLECSGFDSSVVNRERLTVHPGRDLEVTLNRAEGAKYVAIVAGYYSIRKERITKMFEIPVLVKRRGVLYLTKYATLGRMDIEIILGPRQILSSHSEEGK